MTQFRNIWFIKIYGLYPEIRFLRKITHALSKVHKIGKMFLDNGKNYRIRLFFVI